MIGIAVPILVAKPLERNVHGTCADLRAKTLGDARPSQRTRRERLLAWMIRKSRGKLDPLEQEIERALKPGAFIPDAFIPDAFIPDAFIPDAFIPDGACFSFKTRFAQRTSGDSRSRGDDRRLG
ncbi:MAG: hypothetical protein AB1486_28690 [Planctomycetota bacterium]